MRVTSALKLAAAFLLIGFGLYLGFANGIEPRFLPCTKFSIIC